MVGFVTFVYAFVARLCSVNVSCPSFCRSHQYNCPGSRRISGADPEFLLGRRLKWRWSGWLAGSEVIVQTRVSALPLISEHGQAG